MSVPLIRVDADLTVPPYQQIAEQLRGAIQRGDVQIGASLPTVRQLAGDLGVAPNTVARAYAQLQEDGLLIGDGRRGTLVAGPIPAASRRARASTLRDAVERFVESLGNRGFSHREIGDELRRFIS
ncbi:MAG TPA: GntR family transcriptional regulator [Candidatus Baltobacteraceae bacterium]